MKVKVERDLSTADCGDIAITAAEGGINYWARFVDGYDYRRWSPVTYSGDGSYSPDGQGNTEVPEDFVFYTIWSPEGTFEVTPELIARGVQLVLTGIPMPEEDKVAHPALANVRWNFEPRAFADDDFAAMDADEADWVIQLGAFGKLVYG